uniref:CG10920-PA n=1 Tax=Drosophila ananassae TaxID=7217 RepID=D1GXS0_DROAN|nr:CG10920-PA [Drosophila ananassae]
MAHMEFNRQDSRMGFGGGDADNSLIRRHRNEPPHVFEPEFEEEEEELHRAQPRVGIVEYPPVQLIDIEEPLPRPERVERPSRTRHRASRRARDPARERVLISVPCVIPTPRSNQRMIPGSQMICETQPEPLVRRAGGSVDRSTDYARERNAPLEIIRFALRLGYNALLYPYEFAKILIQLGHEPLQARPYTWPFINNRPHLYLPGVHQYVQHIQQVDGFRGLYRGLTARLVSSAIDYLLGDILLHVLRLKPFRRDGPSCRCPPGGKEFLYNLFRDSIRLVTAVLLTQPFHVIMIRQMAQFVGRETIYEGLAGSLMTLVNNDGWLGLYAGVAPRFLSEWLVLVVTSSMSHFCRRFIRLNRVQQQYNAVLIQMAASLLVYPLEVTGSCMACTGAPLVACEPPRMPLYNHWADCLTDLYARGGHNRGALLFWRTIPRIQMQRRQLEAPRAILRAA